jgi:hypothetical protein
MKNALIMFIVVTLKMIMTMMENPLKFQKALHCLIIEVLPQSDHTSCYHPKYFHENRMTYAGQHTPPALKQ